MNQDALTLAAIRDELAELLVGGRVQRVVRPSELGVGLEIYAGVRHQLLLSAEVDGGIALSDDRLRRGVDERAPLHLLLTKYVLGARLTAVLQPPLERVLRFCFAGAQGGVDLVCEVMGRLSNLILVDASGTILECARRVPARINRYRTVLPRRPYVPPPAQHKLDPTEIDGATLQAALAGADGPLTRRLVQVLAGVSPLLAREVTFRALGLREADWPLEQADLQRLCVVLQEFSALPATHQWEPTVGLEQRGDEQVAVAVAPYRLTHCDAWRPIASISRGALLPLAAARPFDPYAGARTSLEALLEQHVDRIVARIAALERANVSPQDLEELQLAGQAILARAWDLSAGASELVCSRAEVTGLAEDGGRLLHVPLDPARSPVENAQAYFARYRKGQAAAEQVPERIAEAREELLFLQQLQCDAALATDRPSLDAVRAALQVAGYSSGERPVKPAASSGPLRLQTRAGHTILVGRNSLENERVTFTQSAPDDLWLHARGVAGAHVVLKTAGVAPDEEELQQAALLAARYSTARHEAWVSVDVTERRHVHRLRGGRPGMVTYRHERVLTVHPAQEDAPGQGG
ncbi:MAG: Rqc2 family fibronectin-binding protein [Anaerolineae bacterium]|jgi:predicted ribosome quality control (RQC) complex YloA/Tae2 family protein